MPAFALHVDSIRHVFDKYKIRKKSFSFALVCLGSVLVDLEEVGVLKNVHGRSEDFFHYLRKVHPKYAPLALGMMLHEELDHAIDKRFTNPSIAKAQRMVKKHLTIKDELTAHLLIDHSVNVNFIKNDPSVIAIAEDAKKRVKERHVHKIAYHLTKFFGGDKQQIISALHLYKNFDLRQYLNEDASAYLYGKFLFLQKEFRPQETGLWTKIRRIFSYLRFILPHRQHEIKELCKKGLRKFVHPHHAYRQAKKEIEKRIAPHHKHLLRKTI